MMVIYAPDSYEEVTFADGTVPPYTRTYAHIVTCAQL